MTEQKTRQVGRQRPGESDWQTINRIMDGLHKSELKNIKEKYLNNKKDFVICVDGVKGTGKSTWGLQSCKWIDKSFDESRVHFYGDDFLSSMKNISEGQAVMLDEAVMHMNRRNAMKKMNKRLITAFNIFRKKAGFIILCIPHFKNLDKGILNEHVFGLVHIKNYQKRSDRQRWEWYSRVRLKNMIKNKYKYSSQRPNKTGVFYDFRPFEEAYEKKKDEAINRFLGGGLDIPSLEDIPNDDIRINGRDLKIKIIKRLLEMGFQQKTAGKIVGYTQQYISHLKREGELD